MSSPKKTDKADKPKPASVPLHIKISADLDARVREFMESQIVPPDKTAVIIKAVEEFLSRQGYGSDQK